MVSLKMQKINATKKNERLLKNTKKIKNPIEKYICYAVERKNDVCEKIKNYNKNLYKNR